MNPPENCPDCANPSPANQEQTRRKFLASTAKTAAFAAAGITFPGLAEAAKKNKNNKKAAALAKAERLKRAAEASKASTKAPQPETLVKTLYDSLSEEQSTKICFPFDHKLRSKVDNNWFVVEDTRISSFNKDQQAMIKEIFMGIHSPEYKDKVYNQVVHDSGRRGWEGGSIAIFGEPGTGKFEFVLTGRHCTRRCDGDSVAGTAFGGPIFYGHAADTFNEGPDHKGNAYWYQAVRANEVYQMLDEEQRKVALHEFGRRETGNATVKLTGRKKGIEGIKVADLSADQKAHTRKVLQDILAPYRKEDVAESMKYIDANGFDNLHLAFYKKGDIGNDQVWDVWKLEGPASVMYFRGAPHVHAWIHVRESAFESKDPFAA